MKMKRIVYLALSSCLLFSCNNLPKYNTIAPEDKPLDAGVILFSQDSNSYFYDIRITDDYLLLLDESNDTVFRAYDADNVLRFSALKGALAGQFVKPQFTKSVIKQGGNVSRIVDNDLYSSVVTLNSGDPTIESTLITNDLLSSKNYNITDNEIYAIPLSGKKGYQFYIYNNQDGYYWVDTDSVLKSEIIDSPVALLSNLCVNEDANRIVSAMRFVNLILFYDLEGSLTQVTSFGKSKILPLQKGENQVDVINSTKCFIDIYGTPKYVYCLYNGASDFSKASTIVVFKWDGTHISTLKSDRFLRNIAVDKDDNYVVALASRSDGGTDVVKYKL